MLVFFFRTDRTWPLNYHFVWDLLAVLSIGLYVEGLYLSPEIDTVAQEARQERKDSDMEMSLLTE
jgi:hypothetical protein